MNKEQLRKHCRENDINPIIEYLSNPFKAIGIDIDDLLIIACQYGQRELAHFLLTDSKLPVKADIEYNQGYALITSCCYGQLEMVKFLLHNEDIPKKAILTSANYKPFISACSERKLEIVKYLLSQPELNNAIELINQGLGFACQNNQMNVVQYLFEDSPCKDQIDIHYQDDVYLNWVCTRGHMRLITYLTTSSTLKEPVANITSYNKAITTGINKRNFQVLDYFFNNEALTVKPDFHYEKDKNFTTALKNNYYPMLNYLILEQKIFRTKNIKQILYANIYNGDLKSESIRLKEASIYANKIFDMVQLNDKLHTTIENKDTNNKNNKNKI